MSSSRLAVVLCLLAPANLFAQWQYASHGPPRPLPAATDRPKGDGPAKFVDAGKGSDAAAGTEAAPWKSLQHAVKQVKPGETLYLRAGVYYEHVTAELKGTAAQPITIRSYPGERGIIDGGLREFYESPTTAWEEVKDGAKGEFQSTKTYPNLVTRADTTNVLGHFGDSLVPLQGYRFLGDLRSDNPYWNVDSKVGGDSFVYCGPGLFFNRETERIHCRLAHTQLSGLGKDNYRGETDPRQLRLIVAAGWDHSPLTLRNCSHVRLLDLSLRGSVETALDIQDSQVISLEGLSVHGASSTVRVSGTQQLLVRDCAIRGNAAPWTFRGMLKYRALESRLFSVNRWIPTGKDSRDIWLVQCELTDSVDGIFLGNVQDWVFSHNLVDNISDDGLFLTSGTAYDGSVVGGPGRVTHNRFSRILTTFAFGVGHGRQKVLPEGRKQTGEEITIARNVFDFRRPVHYRWPSGPDDKQELDSFGRFAGDHGSPAWEPMAIINNTILAADPPRYDYLTDGLGRAMGHGTRRKVINNIVCQTQGLPGSTFPSPETIFQAHHNLAWSLTDGDKVAALFEKARKQPAFAESEKKQVIPFGSGDQFQEPGFVKYSSDWREIADVRLKADSPAAKSGWALSPRTTDATFLILEGAAYRGALQPGAKLPQVGVRGRWNIIGEFLDAKDWRPIEATPVSIPGTTTKPVAQPPAPASPIKRALLVQGYPAFDAPLIEFALRKQGTAVTSVEKTWVSPDEFSKYDLVAFDGSLGRAKISPTAFSASELKVIHDYLTAGGVLVLGRDRINELFATPEGKFWLGEQLKLVKNAKATEYEVLQPKHSWLAHLDAAAKPAWLQVASNLPLSAEAGERLIGSGRTQSLLHRQTIGKGAIIYIGFSPAAALPGGRAKETVEREAEYEAQYKILAAVLKDPLVK